MKAFVTKPAPDFTAQAVVKGQFKEIKLSDYRGKYVVLFFYPLDFTFVCPTELVAFSDQMDEFTKRGGEVLAVSVDSHFSHLAWTQMPRKAGGLGEHQLPHHRRPEQDDLARLRRPHRGGGHRPARPVPDRQGRHHSPRPRQRPAPGPQRHRGGPHARRAATLRDQRRGLPGRLEQGQDGHEAGRGRLEGVLRGGQQVVRHPKTRLTQPWHSPSPVPRLCQPCFPPFPTSHSHA